MTEEVQELEVEPEVIEDAVETEEEETRGEGDNTSKALIGYIERIERLEVEKKDLAEDIKAVKQEAVAKGFDRRTIQEMLKLRALDAEERRKREELRDLYMDALDLL